ncbi:MAG: hypothetical protein MHMPM18_001211 [Marteilia pararefringens]
MGEAKKTKKELVEQEEAERIEAERLEIEENTKQILPIIKRATEVNEILKIIDGKLENIRIIRNKMTTKPSGDLLRNTRTVINSAIQDILELKSIHADAKLKCEEEIKLNPKNAYIPEIYKHLSSSLKINAKIRMDKILEFQCDISTEMSCKVNHQLKISHAEVTEDERDEILTKGKFENIFMSPTLKSETLNRLKDRTEAIEKLNDDIVRISQLADAIRAMCDENEITLGQIEENVNIIQEDVLDGKMNIKKARGLQVARYKMIISLSIVFIIAAVGIIIYLVKKYKK